MPASGRLHVGTSGWSYEHWVGPIYSEGTRHEEMLALYARRFRSVEINATFYGQPDPATVEAWREAVPPGFVFACKAHRYITHMKKLREPDEPIGRFFKTIEGLGRALGPILFQLPPRWHADPARLVAFLEALPPGRRYAFEFRDPSWFVHPIYEALAESDAACCLYELGGKRSPVVLTADFVYLRLHGPGEAYRGSYDEAALDHWSGRVRQWLEVGRDVYCYFDNDEQGFAALDATRLLRRLARGGAVRLPVDGDQGGSWPLPAG